MHRVDKARPRAAGLELVAVFHIVEEAEMFEFRLVQRRNVIDFEVGRAALNLHPCQTGNLAECDRSEAGEEARICHCFNIVISWLQPELPQARFP